MANLLVKTLKYIANNLEADEEDDPEFTEIDYMPEYADYPSDYQDEPIGAIGRNLTSSPPSPAEDIAHHTPNKPAFQAFSQSSGMINHRPMSEILLMEPSNFKDILQALAAVRMQKLVVVNLSKLERDEAQRAIDFMSGGIYIIDGDFEKINESIFLFTPYCIKLSEKAAVNTEPVGEKQIYQMQQAHSATSSQAAGGTAYGQR